MSTGFIFKQPGRLFKHLNVDPGASKEEIFEKYARASYSTENTWPFDSPQAGYYDIKNSDTKLILLNNQKSQSHLRGQLKPKRAPRIKDEFYDWVEIEYQENLMKQVEFESNKNKEKSQTNLRYPDPSRHFTHLGCTYKSDCEMASDESFLKQIKPRNKSAIPRPILSAKSSNSSMKNNQNISQTAVDENILNTNNDELLQYLYFISKREVGYQNCKKYNKPPKEFRDSYNLNHPNLTKGQKLYLYEMCRSYSTNNLKDLKKNQYIELLQKRKKMVGKKPLSIGFHIEFSSKQNQNINAYERFLYSHQWPQPMINTGFISPRKLRPQSRAYEEQIRPSTAIPGRRQAPEIRQINIENSNYRQKRNESSLGNLSTSTDSLDNYSEKNEKCENNYKSQSSSAGSTSRIPSSNRLTNNGKYYNEVSSKDSFITSSTRSYSNERENLSSRSRSLSIDINPLSSKTSSNSSDNESQRNGHIAPQRYSLTENIEDRLMRHRIRRKLSDLSPDQSSDSSYSRDALSSDDGEQSANRINTQNVTLKEPSSKSKNSRKGSSTNSSSTVELKN